MESFELNAFDDGQKSPTFLLFLFTKLFLFKKTMQSDVILAFKDTLVGNKIFILPRNSDFHLPEY